MTSTTCSPHTGRTCPRSPSKQPLSSCPPHSPAALSVCPLKTSEKMAIHFHMSTCYGFAKVLLGKFPKIPELLNPIATSLFVLTSPKSNYISLSIFLILPALTWLTGNYSSVSPPWVLFFLV